MNSLYVSQMFEEEAGAYQSKAPNVVNTYTVVSHCNSVVKCEKLNEKNTILRNRLRA